MSRTGQRLSIIQQLLRRTEAQDLIEYALLAGLISVTLVLVLGPLGQTLSTSYARIGTTISSPGAPGGGGAGTGGNNGNGNGNGGNNGGGQGKGGGNSGGNGGGRGNS
jgi:Flp pilus assembly pilin Flp